MDSSPTGAVLMSEQDMKGFLEEHVDILMEGWAEARKNEWADVVFIWQIDGEDLRHLCAPRDQVLIALEGEETLLPDETKRQLSGPAGDDYAWLLFVTPTSFASMRVHCYYPDVN